MMFNPQTLQSSCYLPMETYEESPAQAEDYRSNVDTSRPFRSVKEAVAILGERFLAGEIVMPMSPLVKPLVMMSPGGEINTDLVRKPVISSREEDETEKGDEKGDHGPGDVWKLLEAELEKSKRELRIVKGEPGMEIFHPMSETTDQEVLEHENNDKEEIPSNGKPRLEDEIAEAEEVRVVKEIEPSKEIVNSASEQPLRSSHEEEHTRNDLKEDQHRGLSDGLKKLEAELLETKKELRFLKERETETEIALAALNAELHKSMSRLAKAEAMEAKAKAVAVPTGSLSTPITISNPINQQTSGVRAGSHDLIIDRHKSYFPTLAQILSVGYDPKNKNKNKKNKKQQQPGCYGVLMSGSPKVNGFRHNTDNKKVQAGIKKEKPIVPLVGDILFSWRKKPSSTSNTFPNSPYSSPHFFK